MAMIYQGKYLYSWNWVGGGYNQCRADSKRQALRCAKEIGEPSGDGGIRLEVREGSLHRVKNEQSFWGNYPMFD